MENEDDGRTIPHTSKSTESPNPADIHPLPSGRLPADDLHCGHNNDSMLPKNAQISEEYMSSVAARIAAQPFQYSDPDVWGVLTAISEKARKRRQGMNMLLTSDEHCIGRLAKDAPFQIISPAVSALHCKLFRRSVATGDTELPLDNCYSVFLKDSSTNGTYLNWKKMTKSSSETKLRHGDIISIAHAPHHEDYDIGNKRLKGIGIGASNGPISLDDFRSLQRSNMELRKLLANHTATIESLRGGNRAAAEKHEIQMRELKELVSKSYLDQLSELNQSLEAKDKELAELNRISAEQKHVIEDLTERLGASTQSCNEDGKITHARTLLGDILVQRIYPEANSVADALAALGLNNNYDLEEDLPPTVVASLRMDMSKIPCLRS